MLSTPLICCSMGVATDASIVWASAPVYVALTWISGGAMFGYSDVGRARMVTAPAITMMIEITIATMGRLMKNFAMRAQFVLPPGWAGAGVGAVGGAASGERTVTVAPSRTFWRPSTTTRSPALTPSSMIHSDPARSPTLTARIATLLSAPTIATW